MKRASVTEELAYGTALDRLISGKKSEPPPTKSDPAEQSKPVMIKLSVFLSREEDAYLENLAATAKFSGGKKISKTRLIEAMVRGFGTTRLDVRGVKTDEELLKRVIAQLRQ